VLRPAAAQLLLTQTAAALRAAGCVFAEDEAQLLLDAAATTAQLTSLVARRVAGEPIEVIVGWAAFCGLRIAVDPGVFVPRRRTEFLAERASELAAPDAIVLDLCCGTGAIGVAVASSAEVKLYASDIEPAAVRCAERNLAAVSGQVFQGDLFDPLPVSLCGHVDLLVVNAPYVPSDQLALLPAEARDHEPRVALDGGPDGVAVHRRVAAEAPRWLAPGGQLLIETSRQQIELTTAALASNGLTPQVHTCPERSATLVLATRGL
jgi:release factor glutamine methyltransferase